MPRSVVVAIACLAWLGLLGAGGTALAALDVLRHGVWAEEGIAARLHLPGRGLNVLLGVLFVYQAAVSPLRGVLRRDATLRRRFPPLGIGMAVILTVPFGMLLAFSLAQGDGTGALVSAAAVVLAAAPFALAAAALSRASAKGWFGG